MYSPDTSSTSNQMYIRIDILSSCFICGRRQRNNRSRNRFLRIGNDTLNLKMNEGTDSETESARITGWIRTFVGLSVNYALCCKVCYHRINTLEEKTRSVKDMCKQTLQALAVSPGVTTTDTGVDHSYCSESSSTVAGYLYSENPKDLFPAEMKISHSNMDSPKATTANLDAEMDDTGECEREDGRDPDEGEQSDKESPEEEEKSGEEPTPEDMTISPKCDTIIAQSNTNSLLDSPTKSKDTGDMSQRRSQRLQSKSRKRLKNQTDEKPKQSKHRKPSSVPMNTPETIYQNKTEKAVVDIPKENDPEEDSPQGDTIEKMGAYKCTYCPATFSSSIVCSKHRTTHDSYLWEVTGDKDIKCKGQPVGQTTGDDTVLFQCKICGLDFDTKESVCKHMKVNHAKQTKPYKCKLCDKSLSTLSSLRQHLERHSANKKFKCPYCGKGYSHDFSYKRHLKIHTLGKSHLCQLCGKLFSAKEGLAYHHKAVHLKTLEKNHVCEVCGKAFDRESKLSKHKVTHTGTSSHLCDICGGTFKERSLEFHRKKCTGEVAKKYDGEYMPYKDESVGLLRCPVCLIKFRTFDLILDHISLVHEKECVVCGAEIGDIKVLTAHKGKCPKQIQRAGVVEELSSVIQTVLSVNGYERSPLESESMNLSESAKKEADHGRSNPVNIPVVNPITMAELTQNIPKQSAAPKKGYSVIPLTLMKIAPQVSPKNQVVFNTPPTPSSLSINSFSLNNSTPKTKKIQPTTGPSPAFTSGNIVEVFLPDKSKNKIAGSKGLQIQTGHDNLGVIQTDITGAVAKRVNEKTVYVVLEDGSNLQNIQEMSTNLLDFGQKQTYL